MIQQSAFRPTRLGLIVLAFVAWNAWGSVATEAMACSCAIRPPALLVDELYDDARAVFVGEPFAITPVMDGDGFVRSVHVDFVVHESWKGVTGSRMGLSTSGDEASCGVDFQVGREYLVLAFASDDGLSANLCAVKGVEAADDELRALAGEPFEDLVLEEGNDPLFPPVTDADRDDPAGDAPPATALCGAGIPMMMLLMSCGCGFHTAIRGRATDYWRQLRNSA